MCAAGISGDKAEPEHEEASSLKEKLWNNESFDTWDDVYRTDVSAVYFTTVAFLPLLQAGTEAHGHLSASVIVISSMSGIMRHSQGHFSYNAAKGGTVQLTKLMSAEFQKAKIRVNSIAPGYFPSEMTMKDSDDRNKVHMPDDKVQDKGHVPAQRSGTDEEMAMAVVCCSWTNPCALQADIDDRFSWPRMRMSMAKSLPWMVAYSTWSEEDKERSGVHHSFLQELLCSNRDGDDFRCVRRKIKGLGGSNFPERE